MMGKRRDLPIAVAIASAGAAVPTLFMLKMLARNNNQGELFDTTGAWNVGYALQVCAIFFVPSFLVIFAIIMLVRGARDEIS